MIFDGFVHQMPDIDPGETAEWLDSFEAVVDERGRTRGRFLISKLQERARELQVQVPTAVSSPYINTISPGKARRARLVSRLPCRWMMDAPSPWSSACRRMNATTSATACA